MSDITRRFKFTIDGMPTFLREMTVADENRLLAGHSFGRVIEVDDLRASYGFDSARRLLIAEGPFDATQIGDSVSLMGKATKAPFSQPIVFMDRDIQAMKRERFEPGDRKLHAPERRRPKRIAKKLRKRYGAQHYRDAYRCFEIQAKQASRPGKLEREILALQRRVHDDQLDALMLYGDSLYRESFLPTAKQRESLERFGVSLELP